MNRDKVNKPSGGLMVSLTESNYVLIGDMRIYLDHIKVSGTEGGKKIVVLRLLGPRSTKILRCERD